MRSASLAFLLGVALILGLPQLPGSKTALTIFCSAIALLIFLPRQYLVWLRLPLIVALGFSWAVLHANQRLDLQVPESFFNKPITVIGTIASIPEAKNYSVNFVFAVKQIDGVEFTKPLSIRLTWFGLFEQLHIGDQWQLTVRLKQVRNSWNPGSFDYQKWLFEQGIRATGYVVVKGNNQLQGTSRFNYIIDKKRQELAEAISKDLLAHPLKGLITALAVGIRDQITESQWATLRATGTNHLFAIAGLHIGFVTGIIYGLVSFLWRRVGRLSLYLPTPQAAVLSSLIVAMLYSALAGFSLPTQRALLMTIVFLLGTLLRKNLAPWSAWCLALLTILVIEPLAVLSDSFWLSFAAVAVIIYGVGGRLKLQGLWNHWGRIQWVLTIGLIPFCLLFFQQTSLLGFIANVIAIPWVGFIVLPATLLGDLLWQILPQVAEILWLVAESALELIWIFLEAMAKVNGLQWEIGINSPWILFTSIVAIILLLLPRGCHSRCLGLIWGLPLIFWASPTPSYGSLWLTLLNVDSGIIAVMQTQHHALVFEAGKRLNNIEERVLLPFLRQYGIRRIDSQIKPGLTAPYVNGQLWQWDGVIFQVFYPPYRLRMTIGKQTVDLGEINLTYKTAEEGAITLQLTGDGVQRVISYKKSQLHFWQQ